MVDIEGITGTGKQLLNNVVTWGIWGGITILGLAVLITLAVVVSRKKKWNLTSGIKLLGNDGRIIGVELGKGHYAVKEGIVDIKRKKMKPVGTKPFDLRKYRQGIKYVEFLQLSPTEYLPIHPKSYHVITDEKTGEKYALLDIEADLSKRKTWTTYMERTGKDRFTLKGLLEKHWRALEMGIIMFMMFVGFAVLWTRIG